MPALASRSAHLDAPKNGEQNRSTANKIDKEANALPRSMPTRALGGLANDNCRDVGNDLETQDYSKQLLLS